MTDQELIASLTADLQPVAPYRVERELAVAAGAGGLVSLAVLVGTLGIQPGLDGPALGPLLLKAGYGLAIAAVGMGAALHMARPASARRPVLALLGAAFVTLGVVATVQLAHVEPAAVPAMVMGQSWPWCSLRIAALALPILFAMVATLRRQAPVRPRQAGAAAGLVAGALAAAIYALACTEHAAAFVLVWYTAGIAAMAGLGWLLGPKILRW